MGTISDKTTYLNTTKTLIREKINDLGQNLDTEDTFRSYVEALEQVYEDYPKTTTTNVTEPSIDNTKAGRMRIDLKGNTDQFTTTGKNFLNLNSMTGTTTSTGVTVTPILKNNLLQYIKLTGTPSGTFWYQIGSVTLEPGDYIFSGIDVNNTGLKIALNTSALYIDKDNPTLTLNLTTRYTYTINIWCNNSSLYPTGEIKLKPMIRLSSIADDTYEPYTGATASPNPDYPQDVEVVSGENTVKVVNKNLVPNNWLSGSISGTTGNVVSYNSRVYTANKIKLKENTTYCLKLYNESNYTYRCAVDEYDINNNYLGRIGGVNGGVDGQFITQSNTQYINITIIETTDTITYSAYQDYLSNGTLKLQLEEGSTVTTYAEHKEQDFPISLHSRNLISTNPSDWEQGSLSNTGEPSMNTRIRTKNYYPIITNTDYYITIQEVETYCFLNIYFYDTSKNYVGQVYDFDSSINGATSMKFNVSNVYAPNLAYMRVIIRNKNNDSIITPSEINIIKPQIEQGSTATTYQPFYDYELCKIGDYQDYIYKNNDNWYIKKNIDKVVLDGSGNWSNPSTNRFNVDGIIPNNNYLKNTNITYYCNNYKGYEKTDTNAGFNTLVENESYGFNFTNNINNNTIRFKDIRYTLLNDFKTWLSTHNAIIYYVLATAQDILITDTTLISQLNALEKAKSYDNVTNIIQENNDLPFILDIKTLKKS